MILFPAKKVRSEKRGGLFYLLKIIKIYIILLRRRYFCATMSFRIKQGGEDMIYTPMTKKALKLCFEAHRDQVDKTGMPYVFHPFHLAEQMDDEISTVCALLHDVVEDSEISFEELKEMGFPSEVIEVLRLLSHKVIEYAKNRKN